MKNSMWDNIMIVLAAIATISSTIVLVILVSSIITTGATAMRVWGLIGLIVAIMLSAIILGMLVYSKKRPVQRTEVKG